MKLKNLFVLCFCLLAIQVHSQTYCDTFKLKYNDKDTSIVRVLHCVVYDTIAISLNGYVHDISSGEVISGAIIEVEYGEFKTIHLANEKGEFNFWILPQSETKLNLKITYNQFRCLVVKDVIQCGGQWIKFKLKKV